MDGRTWPGDLWRSVLGFFGLAHAACGAFASRSHAPADPLGPGGLLCSRSSGVLHPGPLALVHLLGCRQRPALFQAPGAGGSFGAVGPFFTSRALRSGTTPVLLALVRARSRREPCPRPAAIALGVACGADLLALAVTFENRAAYLGLLVARSRPGSGRAHRVRLLWSLAAAAAPVDAASGRPRAVAARSPRTATRTALHLVAARRSSAITLCTASAFANYPRVLRALLQSVGPALSPWRTWAHTRLSPLARHRSPGSWPCLLLFRRGAHAPGSARRSSVGALAALAPGSRCAGARNASTTQGRRSVVLASAGMAATPPPAIAG